MKVLLIDVNCQYSSTGKIVYSLFKSLNADGHEARLAYGRGPVVEKDGVYKFGIDLETKLHALKARITGRNGCYSPKSTANLIAYIKDFKPDLVHIHELHAYFVDIRTLLGYLKKEQIPVVWTFHCEFMYTGKCGFAFECERYKTGCGSCPHMSEYVKSLFFDKTKELLEQKKRAMDGLNIKAIVTPSIWLADRTKETYLGHYNIQVVHNGIDTDGIFFPRDNADELKMNYGIHMDRKVVLAVAPNIMEDRKGGRTVIDLARIMPETDFVLAGADETRREAENVFLIERTRNQDELAQWYSIADLFIICSKAENFPTTCIEAMCCGTPVAGIDAGGTAETAASPYGSFVKAADYNELLDGLKGAVADQLGKNLASDEIREYAVKEYDNSVMYKNYLEIYLK